MVSTRTAGQSLAGRRPRGRGRRLPSAALVLLLVLVAIAILAPLIAPFPGDGGSATHPELALQGVSSDLLADAADIKPIDVIAVK